MLARSALFNALTGGLCALFGLAVGLKLDEPEPVSVTPVIQGTTAYEHRSLPDADSQPETLNVEAIGDRLAQRVASELAATVEDKLALALESWSPERPGATTCASEVKVAATPEEARQQKRAFEDGADLLAEAVGQRYWSLGNAEELNGLLPTMSIDQRAALFAQLADAANRGEIEIGDDPLAFYPGREEEEQAGL